MQGKQLTGQLKGHFMYHMGNSLDFLQGNKYLAHRT